MRRTPEQYVWERLEFDTTILPADPQRFTKHDAPREIDFIAVHHMTIIGDGDGQANDACMRTWRTRKASAHYGIDGPHVRQFVWDKDVAWALGHWPSNVKSISIEHANATGSPTWRVSDETMRTGAALVAHLCKAYGIGRPEAGTTVRRHRDFIETACPGPYLGGSHFAEYVAEAQRVYDAITKRPRQVFDSRQWKLTTPEADDDGDPIEIKHPALATFEDSPWFVRLLDRLRIRTPVEGATTDGTKYARNEFREMTNGGRDRASWNSNDGKARSLLIDVAVRRLPGRKPEAVVAQIHDAHDDVVMVRVVGLDSKRCKVVLEESKGKGQGSEKTLLGTVEFGQRFRVQIISHKGIIRVWFRRNTDPAPEDPIKIDRSIEGGYRKAGVYAQANESNGTGYAEADFYVIEMRDAA